jgi:hypothetical protein
LIVEVIMPVCEGLPSGPCPQNRSDKSVVIGKGDLLLCQSCDTERRRLFDENKKPNDIKSNAVNAAANVADETSKKSRPTRSASTRGMAGVLAASSFTEQSGGSHVTILPAATESYASSSTSLASSASVSGTTFITSGRRNPTADIATDASQSSTSVSRSVQLSATVGTTDATKVVLNELLAYVNSYRHNSTAESLRKVVVVHFSQDDIAAAKRLLVQECQSISGVAQFTLDRRNSTARQAHEAEVEDIIAIFDVVDTRNLLMDYLFVASNLQMMPKYGPEEINLAVVVDRQVQMDVAIANLSTSVEKLSRNSLPSDSSFVVQQSVANDIQQQLGAFNDAIGARLDHLTSVCTQLAENAKTRSVVYTSPRAERKSHDVDRSMNIMVFGVAENRDVRVWRSVVDRALQFVTGCVVDVKDMLRVGRYADGKKRPIIVKLRTSWDRRIILAECSKLKDFEERVFFAADEPVEERRQKMLIRIKTRAESSGQVASVVDGVLSVDGVPVFSLKDGKISQDGGL